MDNPSITIAGPGFVHTDLEGIKRASARLNRESNNGLDDVERATGTLFAKDQLKSIIERVERLEEEKAEIAEQVREVYAEAKGNGFDVAALKAIVRMRKQDANERAERETILETYMAALGMLL